MKSIYRCTASHQGDRCKLARYHARDAAAKSEQSPHAGAFTLWNDEGVLGKAQGAEIRRKRNRTANRAFRNLTGAGVMSGEAVKAGLGKLVEFYGGSK